MEREANTEYILSLSYGKDSLACLEAIKQLNYPLDRIVHAEVWATDTILADLPPMIEFKAHADKIIKEKYGYTVEHICAMRRGQKVSYDTQFYKRIDEGRNKNRIYGFPYTLGAWCNDRLKVNALQSISRESNLRKTVLSYTKETEKDTDGECGGKENSPNGFPVQQVPWCNSGLKQPIFRQLNSRIPNYQGSLVQQLSQNPVFTVSQSQSAEGTGVHNSNRGFSGSPIAQGAKKNIVQYLGIAADEPKRIKKHTVPGKMLPLVDIGWDEAYCRQWCEDNDLLSPIYTTSTRGGCWFCHNQGVNQLRLLRRDYPDLWQLLLKWDKDSSTTFKADGHTIHDFDLRFKAEDLGLITAGDKRFRWKQVLSPTESVFTEPKCKQMKLQI